jgi:hypothetical protein
MMINTYTWCSFQMLNRRFNNLLPRPSHLGSHPPYNQHSVLSESLLGEDGNKTEIQLGKSEKDLENWKRQHVHAHCSLYWPLVGILFNLCTVQGSSLEILFTCIFIFFCPESVMVCTKNI